MLSLAFSLILLRSLEDLTQWCYRAGSDASKADVEKMQSESGQDQYEYRRNKPLPEPYQTAHREKVIFDGIVWYPEEPLKVSRWSKTKEASLKVAGACMRRVAGHLRRYVLHVHNAGHICGWSEQKNTT